MLADIHPVLRLAVTLSVIVLAVIAYFLPALIASRRKHPNRASITILNLLLGWSLLGWVIALIWSASAFQGRTA